MAVFSENLAGAGTFNTASSFRGLCVCGLSSVSSLAELPYSMVAGFPEGRGGNHGFLREKPGTGPVSVPPQSLDESKSQGQLRFEG